RGGMGEVYAAQDEELSRRVAVKVLGGSLRGSPGAAQRLLREAQAMAQLNHPNIVTVYDVGSEGEELYVAMELVDGESLRHWLLAAVRGWPEIVRVFLQAARGLAAAHAAGIVHRDFKPDNVLVSRDGRVRVADFGLARLAAERDEAGVERVSGT